MNQKMRNDGGKKKGGKKRKHAPAYTPEVLNDIHMIQTPFYQSVFVKQVKRGKKMER